MSYFPLLSQNTEFFFLIQTSLLSVRVSFHTPILSHFLFPCALTDMLCHFPTFANFFSGTHRDWPDSRGLYCSTWEGLPAIAVWVNFEDHVSVGRSFSLHCFAKYLLRFLVSPEGFKKSRRPREGTFSTYFGNFRRLSGLWRHLSICVDKSSSKTRV